MLLARLILWPPRRRFSPAAWYFSIMPFPVFALAEHNNEKRLENEAPLCRRQKQHVRRDRITLAAERTTRHQGVAPWCLVGKHLWLLPMATVRAPPAIQDRIEQEKHEDARPERTGGQ